MWTRRPPGIRSTAPITLTDNGTVENNNITSAGVGILVVDSQDVVARFNLLTPNNWPQEMLVGIWLESSERVDASSNNMWYYRIGVLAIDCEECMWLDNDCFDAETNELVIKT